MDYKDDEIIDVIELLNMDLNDELIDTFFKKYIKYVVKNKNYITIPNKIDICKKNKIFDISTIKTVSILNSNMMQINGLLFMQKNELGSGTYGNVYEYITISGERIAIKKSATPGKLKDEINMITLLNQGDNCLSTYVKTFVINDDTIAIEYMDNNAYGIELKLKSMIKRILFFKELVKLIYCLSERQLYYTDIKLDNILYRCNNNNSITIVLGDLGSIHCIRNKNYSPVSTYPPPEYPNGHIGNEEQDEVIMKNILNKSIVWTLGILFLLMFENTKETNYYWDDMNKAFCSNKDLFNDTLERNIQIDINRIFTNLKKLYTFKDYKNYVQHLENIIINILQIQSQDRMDIRDLYEQLFYFVK